MFKFTEFGKKSGSIHKKNIQKAFHQKYLTLNASLCAQKAKKDVSMSKKRGSSFFGKPGIFWIPVFLFHNPLSFVRIRGFWKKSGLKSSLL